MSLGESYVFYSSITLFAFGCLALGLSILFRLKSRDLKSLPKNLSATVFNRTFTVFDPYPQHTKVIHSFLLALPFVALFVTIGLTLVMWEILASGLILSVLIIIIGLNLVVIEEAPEAYMNSATFIKAVRSDTNLATGDLKALRLIRDLAPKLSNYYFGLSMVFVMSSIALSYVWTSVPEFLMQLIRLIAQTAGLNEIAVFPATVVLLVLGVSILQLLVLKIKNRIFRFETM